MKNDFVHIKKSEITREMKYKDETILSYKIEYPVFSSEKYKGCTDRLNLYYRVKAYRLKRYYETVLFKEAAEQYEYSKKNNFPVRAFEALFTYIATYNENCTVSLYFDKYEFTGGAHGNTVRTSDTWQLQTCHKLPLSGFFPVSSGRDMIIHLIIRQIERNIKANESYYFEDYNENVKNTFNPESYYINEKGIVIYFQQYEIAPYSSGIVEFLLPFTKGIIKEPSCK